jgi:hypothetical protein
MGYNTDLCLGYISVGKNHLETNMKPLKKLSIPENERLLKFPDYISLLASNNFVIIDKVEIKAAIKFKHTKIFSSSPLITEYYKNDDEVFEENMKKLKKDLPKGNFKS